MTVPSKSKNAPIVGPDGPAWILSISSDSDTGDLRPVLRIQGFSCPCCRHQVADVGRPAVAPSMHVLTSRLEQIVVLGQLQGGAEQLSRQRLRPVQAALQ